jgi:hypothetical protein
LPIDQNIVSLGASYRRGTCSFRMYTKQGSRTSCFGAS